MKTNKLIITIISVVSIIFTLFVLIFGLILPYFGISPFFELYGGMTLILPPIVIIIICAIFLFLLASTCYYLFWKTRKFKKSKQGEFGNIKYYNKHKEWTNPSNEGLYSYIKVDQIGNQNECKLEKTVDSFFKEKLYYNESGDTIGPKDLKLYVKNSFSLKGVAAIFLMILFEVVFLLICNNYSSKYMKNAEALSLNSDYMINSHMLEDGESIVVDSLMARFGVEKLVLPLFADGKKVVYGQNSLKSLLPTIKYEISFINSNDEICFDSKLIKNNTHIVSVKLPKNLKYIDSGVLSGATNISTLELPIINKDTDKDDAFIMYLYGYDSNGVELNSDNNAIKDYESIENIIINNGTISKNTFAVVQKTLKTLTILDGVNVDENVAVMFDDKIKLTIDTNLFEGLYESLKFKLNDNTNVIKSNTENQFSSIIILDLYEEGKKLETQCLKIDYNKDSKVNLEEIKNKISNDLELKGIIANYEGYVISGWQTNIDGSFKNYNLSEYTMDKNIIVKAVWEKENCKLTIENQNMDRGSVVGDGDYKYGDMVHLVATPKDGYIFAGWYEGTNLISNELNYDYEIKTKEKELVAKWIEMPISVIYSENKGSYSFEGERYIGSSIKLSAMPKIGYNFAGWVVDNVTVSNDEIYTFTMPEYPVEIKANFMPKDGVVYHVNHYIQNLDDDGYTLKDDDKLTGVTGESTEALAKNYDGFTVLSFTQKTINGDGSTVVDIKYRRDSYKIEFSSANSSYGIVSLSGGTYKYGKSISVTATANTGYYFLGWYEDNLFIDNAKTITFNVINENRKIVAKFSPNTNTKYKVKHYQENVTGDKYVLVETEEKTGTTGSITTASAKKYTNFTAQSFFQHTIKGDGTTVVEIRYSRNTYLLQVRSDEPDDKGISKNSVVLKVDGNTTAFDSKNDHEARTDENWENFRYKKQITYGKKVTISYSFAAQDNRSIGFTINGKRYSIYSASDADAINKVFEKESVKLDLTVNFDSSLSFNMIGEIDIWWSAWGCFAEGTEILMGDGSTKKVEDLHVGDIVMSWNFEKGILEAMPISLYWYHGTYDYAVINLEFSNNTILRLIQSHGLFDMNLNEFVYITTDNYQDYIGHQFVIYDENGYDTVTLIKSYITVEEVGSYSLRTACNDNAYAEGFLSLTPEDYKGFLTYFEVGENLKYDEDKMNADIEKYGLCNYDDWKDYVSIEEFIALNGKYLNVLIGKGILKYEDIIELIEGMR